MSSQPARLGYEGLTTESDRVTSANAATPGADEIRQRVLEYYTAATLDYKAWSSGFNMHFGYWRPGINPFRRESMLNELNLQVLSRLQLPRDRPARLADLGGGTGATARAAVKTHPQLAVDVVTIVPLQIDLGRKLNAGVTGGGAIAMHCVDFNDTGLPAGQYDGVCMIESAIYAEGPTKARLIREAFRLLRPGGTMVMVDGMLVRRVPTDGIVARFMDRVYRRWCLSWAVPEMCRTDLLPAALAAAGFEAPTVEDWGWNIAPSVAHVPLLAFHFALAEIVKARGRLPLWRWRHIVASALTPMLGLRRSTFIYAAVVAKKPLR